MKFSQLPLPSRITANESFDIIDSSKLRDFMRCGRYYFFRHVLGYGLDMPNHDLYFGTSVHAAMEYLMTHGMNKDSIKGAIEAFNTEYRKYFPPETDGDYKGKNPANLVNILIEYVAKYGSECIKVLYTEVGGEVPITDERNLTFRIDVILERDGKKYVRDFKTGSTGSTWWKKQWRLSTQVGTYLHVLHCLYDINEIGGFEVDGLLFKEPLKSGEVKNELVRVTEVKTPADMNAWLVRTMYWVEELEKNFHLLCEDKAERSEMRAFPQRESGCIYYNRMCEYWSVCSNYANPLQIERVPADFHVNFWNPLEKETKITLEEIKNENTAG